MIEIFDTTLRDGTQAEGVNLSVEDKLKISQYLDDFGVDFIEGGWPGSNPKDEEFFFKAKSLHFENSKLCAFGSTSLNVSNIQSDINLNALLAAETPSVCIFGKAWRFHTKVALGLSDEENRELIYKSVEFLKNEGRYVIFDAEHFFDGYKDDPNFSLSMIKSAKDAGADMLVLCDTNGGCLSDEIGEITKNVKKITQSKIGIHAHNDSGLGVANSLSAIKNGAEHVQGTINGVGERCGNADLSSIIPNLIIKMQKQTNSKINLTKLTSLSSKINETMNLVPNSRAPFIGKSAFAHKGGIHVSAVLKDSSMYEHINPKLVGSSQRVLVSDLSGKSNIKYKLQELGIKNNDIDAKDMNKKIVSKIKELEHSGFQFDGAEGSFELLVRKESGDFKPFFKRLDSKVIISSSDNLNSKSEAILKINVNDKIEHTASEGVGPVHALNKSLKKALINFYPEIKNVKLVDYKVRVLNTNEGSISKVRVLVESSYKHLSWTCVGLSDNIIEASWQAISDSLNYVLFKLYSSSI